MKHQILTVAVCAVAMLAADNCRAQGRIAHNLPPAQRLMEPGPGVGGPGPGVINPMGGIPGRRVAPAMAMGGAPGCAPMGPAATSQIAFLGSGGTEVAWDISGQGLFDSVPLVIPGRQNFSQGAIYRLKLTNLTDRPGVELYPTLEIAPVTPRTDAYLAHAPIPVQFTDEDLDQVLSGNFVTKVVYLPDPEFQELALAGVETLVSTRLDPGVDPIAEADRRGSIMAILRIGNLDLQLPGNGLAMQGGVSRAQYDDAGHQLGPNENEFDYQDDDLESIENSGYDDGARIQRTGGYGYAGSPQGMSTAGFAPQPAPPHMVAGMNTPQWGMPSVGTPIGLPGPPHIPLGHAAGLTSHTIRNRTRVQMPPPVHKVNVKVKQRPGLSYPRPVNRVNIAETNRAGARAVGGTVPTGFQRFTNWLSNKH